MNKPNFVTGVVYSWVSSMMVILFSISKLFASHSLLSWLLLFLTFLCSFNASFHFLLAIYKCLFSVLATTCYTCKQSPPYMMWRQRATLITKLLVMNCHETFFRCLFEGVVVL